MPDHRSVRDGLDGLDGASAFEIAKVHGFVGTQQEWLASLKGQPGDPAAPVDWQAVVAAIEEESAKHPGPKGERGEPGLPGRQGDRGPAGADGRDGTDGALPAPAAWMATFHRDDEGRTVRLDLECSSAAQRPWSIFPVRPGRDGRMTHAQIVPF